MDRGGDREITRAAGDIEIAVGLKKPHFFRGTTPPGHVASQTQKMVQKIIFAGDRGKNLFHHADPIGIRDFFDGGIFFGDRFFHKNYSGQIFITGCLAVKEAECNE